MERFTTWRAVTKAGTHTLSPYRIARCGYDSIREGLRESVVSKLCKLIYHGGCTNSRSNPMVATMADESTALSDVCISISLSIPTK